MLGGVGDTLERPGHGELDGGGAPAGLGEEAVAPGDSGQPKRRRQDAEKRWTETIA